ncbi:ABC transporter substrate-binding protein [Komagataeibacter rhaeticus]|nr:ABC transporter substrate-binding protein [Komagataeibacter rhaeticus]
MVRAGRIRWFYEALAKGYYASEGLDVQIEAASPQMNVPQLLLAGRADFITGYDFQVLSAVASGIPLVAVASTFQHDQQGLMTHDGITSPEQLRGHPILIASSSHATFWPWLKEKYGFDDSQAARYTFNLQPFSQIRQPLFRPMPPLKSGMRGSVASRYGFSSLPGWDTRPMAHPS